MSDNLGMQWYSIVEKPSVKRPLLFSTDVTPKI
jgi:hypothetical protein